jgi:hypothetical protein
MMGHRHITTTERYLHYAPDPEAAAKLSGLWGGPAGQDGANVVAIRRGDGEPMGSPVGSGSSHTAAGGAQKCSEQAFRTVINYQP